MNFIENALGRLMGAPISVFYDEAYRWPLANLEAHTGFDPRRADDALWYLLKAKATTPALVHKVELMPYEGLARVHSREYLESLSRPEVLAQIFATVAWALPVDEMLRTLRLACGATWQAAKWALEKRKPCLNLLGGFHHAAPSRGAGFCAVNDVAVAISMLRHEGFDGRVAILDLDAHPPDGTAECLLKDNNIWHLSLSSVDWGPLPNVRQVSLPTNCSDDAYLSALETVLREMPKCQLAFVLAGGDVLAGDPLGHLGVSLRGARLRDLHVKKVLKDIPSVWLPSGGYTPNAWKVLAGTGLALAFDSTKDIPSSYQPLSGRFGRLSRQLRPEMLGSEPFLTEEDVAEALGTVPSQRRKMLGFYSREGIEFALFHFGILSHLRRLGYADLHVTLTANGSADRVRLTGKDNGHEHLLIEVEVERRNMAQGTFLFINWASLRHPKGKFQTQKPQLPGQEVPGLGLSKEMTEMFTLMARRLALDGVAFRPSWYHIAYACRHTARFLDAKRQGRFEALIRDLGHVPLRELTLALAENRVQMNGALYTWEPDDMVVWLHPGANDSQEVTRERERVRFERSSSEDSA